MKEEDLLILTADHGCDPTTPGTDHTREQIPLIVYGKNIKVSNLGLRESFSDIGKTILDVFGIGNDLHGKSFKCDIILNAVTWKDTTEKFLKKFKKTAFSTVFFYKYHNFSPFFRTSLIIPLPRHCSPK